MEEFFSILIKFHAIVKRISRFYQFLRKFHLIFEKILFIFKESFPQFLRKFYPIFNEISHNSQENFSQFLKEFHSNFSIFKRIWQVHVTGSPKTDFENEQYIIILYNFVHRVPNFVHHSLLHYRQFKFGGWWHAAPQLQFQQKTGS